METKQSFGLRKLSVGLASVLIGISFLSGTKTNVVKADTKESVQDVQNKNNEDLQAAILKNTSSQNADAQNTTHTDHTNVNADSGTSAMRDASAVQVEQVAGAECGDSSARETQASQLKQVNSSKSTQASQLKQVNSSKSTQASQLKQVNSSKSTQASQLKQVNSIQIMPILQYLQY